jgi:hypothetical protein
MSDYQVEITYPRRDNPFVGQLTVRIVQQGKEVYSFKAHKGTVFSRYDNILYIAEFSPMGCGCSVVAYDFKAKKELWKCRLQGPKPLNHSVYHNAVTIENDWAGALVIRGNESMQKYVEYVDMATGKSLAFKNYPLNEK